jgi:predicted enzyme related to lactoylglutathione lyase
MARRAADLDREPIMTNHPPPEGRFVWYELVTPDKDAAKHFYAAIFGWEWRDEEMGELGIYPLAHTGESQHCGLISPQEGMPPHWIGYVTVADVDRACEQAGELGGKVVMPATDIPGVGRYAGLEDPGGAVIMPFKGHQPPGAETPVPAPAGFFCWNELLTADPAASVPFYAGIFGWETEKNEMPEMGTYWVFRRGDRLEGGMLPMPAEAGHRPHWLPYVAVNDVGAAAAKVGELDGKVYVEPTEIPEMGRFAVAADPQGAVFAMFQSA